MTRHPVDKDRPASTARLREFVRQEREQNPHPAIDSLRSRPQTRPEDSRKAGEYARIERGRTT